MTLLLGRKTTRNPSLALKIFIALCTLTPSVGRAAALIAVTPSLKEEMPLLLGEEACLVSDPLTGREMWILRHRIRGKSERLALLIPSFQPQRMKSVSGTFFRRLEQQRRRTRSRGHRLQFIWRSWLWESTVHSTGHPAALSDRQDKLPSARTRSIQLLSGYQEALDWLLQSGLILSAHQHRSLATLYADGHSLVAILIRPFRAKSEYNFEFYSPTVAIESVSEPPTHDLEGLLNFHKSAVHSPRLQLYTLTEGPVELERHTPLHPAPDFQWHQNLSRTQVRKLNRLLFGFSWSYQRGGDLSAFEGESTTALVHFALKRLQSPPEGASLRNDVKVYALQIWIELFVLISAGLLWVIRRGLSRR